MTYNFSVGNNTKQTTMPEVNRFEIHGERGVVRFDVILEDAKVKKTPIKRISTFGETTAEERRKQFELAQLTQFADQKKRAAEVRAKRIEQQNYEDDTQIVVIEF